VGQFHFRPDDYLELMHAEIPAFEDLQDHIAAGTEGLSVARVLDLGTGTGETARRVLQRHPAARVTGIDMSEGMLGRARDVLPPQQVDELLVRSLQEPLPAGPFELAISGLAIHHLDDPGKADLFHRVARTLRAGGRFVMGDVVVPESAAEAVTPLSPDFDLPSPTGELLDWLQDAGFLATVFWSHQDLVVIRADRP
jgi:tRNA (cmo5U34)-methyltransferase